MLVVEDDATLARAIARNLSVRGYTARAAYTVGDAVDAQLPASTSSGTPEPDGQRAPAIDWSRCWRRRSGVRGAPV